MAEGKKYGGRVAGTANKSTTKAKEGLMQVFRALGDIDEMTRWAKENQTEFYKLWARLVPTEVHGKGFVAAPVKESAELSDREFAKRVAYVLNAGIHDKKVAEIFATAEKITVQ